MTGAGCLLVLLDIIDCAALSLTELAALLGPGDGPTLLYVETVPAVRNIKYKPASHLTGERRHQAPELGGGGGVGALLLVDCGALLSTLWLSETLRPGPH